MATTDARFSSLLLLGTKTISSTSLVGCSIFFKLDSSYSLWFVGVLVGINFPLASQRLKVFVDRPKNLAACAIFSGLFSLSIWTELDITFILKPIKSNVNSCLEKWCIIDVMAVKSKNLTVKGRSVSLIHVGKDDYISLTDIAKYRSYDSGVVISNWLSTKYTVQFMGAWEQIHNPSFNLIEFHKIKNETGTNGFIISSSFWVRKTNAIGIKSSPGRYGGTYAHKDIAFEFATWISPEFKLYLITEFQRLKDEEASTKNLEWSVNRILSKVNYRIHTDAIKQNLIPPKITKPQTVRIYANEADVLNMALFGMTAKTWRDKHPGEKGNIRDFATIEQLVVLVNLENLNALFIEQKMSQDKRLSRLNKTAIRQIGSLLRNSSVSKLKSGQNVV